MTKFRQKYINKMKELRSTNIKIKSLCIAVALVLSGCASRSEISEQARSIAPQEQWAEQNVVLGENDKVINDWLGVTDDLYLRSILNLALQNDFNLKASALDVSIAKEALQVSESADFPELSLNINQRRIKTVDGDDERFNNSAEIALQLTYELDLWGKLSDEQQQAELLFSSVQAQYQNDRINLLVDVVNAWYSLLESEALLTLYQERDQNLQNNLDIIKGSYRLGISSALDVYLSQNELNLERARVAQQQQRVLENRRNLQLYIGHYPSGIEDALQQQKAWPSLSSTLYVELPASLLANRADIQASWLDLMASDAAVAVAHKQRFPQFTLSASAGDASDELSNLLKGDALAWSLLGNITTPLFNAGKLESLEEQARLKVKQKEQRYLELVYQAFADAENQLNNHNALNEQLSFYKQAEANALAAESLSFSQYQKGLVSYTTVLESQRRAFDSQTAAIQLTKQMIQNRATLYATLGGVDIEQSLVQKIQDSSTAPNHLANIK